MSPLEEHITKIIDAKHRLDDLRKQSPEIAEALRISDVYHGLMQDLREKLDARAPQIVTVPYPAYPFWQGPAVYQSDSTLNANPTVNQPASGVTLQIVK